MGVYWVYDDKAKITLLSSRSISFNCECFEAPAGSQRGHQQTCGAPCIMLLCLGWRGDALPWINLVNKNGARKDLFAQIQTLPSFLLLSPKFDVTGSYTCHFPGIWAAARTPSGCCHSGSRHLCRSGSKRRECCPYRHSIQSPPLSEWGIIFPPPLPSG